MDRFNLHEPTLNQKTINIDTQSEYLKMYCSCPNEQKPLRETQHQVLATEV
jgi:hypothetical protein